MAKSKDIAYLRQLCCAGLPKEVAIREFLDAVKRVIPSGNNVYVFCNSDWIPHQVFFSSLNPALYPLVAEITPAYFDAQKRAAFKTWFSRHPTLADPRIYDSNFYHSDFYNLVWRPGDQHFTLQTPVTQHGKVIGSPCLIRSASEKPFSDTEQATLARLMPYLSHAVQNPQRNDLSYCDSGQLGLLVVDSIGKLLYLNELARQYLDWACDSSVAMAKPLTQAELKLKLQNLCRNLNHIYQGLAAKPPAFSISNSRGRFTFRGQWLSKENHEPGNLVAIDISHEVPVLLKILRALRYAPLSPSQKEVAALIAQGKSNLEIGQALHIKPATVKEYIHQIFSKFAITHRDQLVAKLLDREDAYG